MSTTRSGFQPGSTRSALTRARHSASARRNAYEAMKFKHEQELERGFRALVEAESLVKRLESESGTTEDQS